MKNILFVIFSLPNGGAEKSLVNLLNELDPVDYNVDLCLFAKEGMFLKQVPSYVNILEPSRFMSNMYTSGRMHGVIAPIHFVYKCFATLLSRIKEPVINYSYCYRFLNFYRPFLHNQKKNYDVAVAYLSGENMLYVSDKVSANRKIVFVHNDYRAAGHPKKYEKSYFAKMNRIVTISDTCVEILKEEFPELSDRITMVPNITSSAVIRNRANESTPEEWSDGSFPRILSIGRLTEQKGFDLAIEAAAILKSRGIIFKWYIIGNGVLQVSLEKHIKQYEVEDCFILLGPKENPYPYIKNCTIFAQPSRWEGKSVVLDEAKILGKPILATAYPTVHDQIIDKKEGIVVPMTPVGIADGIEMMLSDADLLKKLTEFLNEHEYGNQAEIRKYIQLFSE